MSCAAVGVCKMACYKPVASLRLDDGTVLFGQKASAKFSGSELELPCRQCIGCRLERSRQWAMRCLHEASIHDGNMFVTLTYDDEHLPKNGSLVYRDVQLFLKRLRKKYGKVSFYCGGEYGSLNARPHYHLCIFGLYFDDRKLFSERQGNKIYTSDNLSSLWPLGFSCFGDVTFQSAAYIARYCVQKVTGQMADEHYRRIDLTTGEVYNIEPEFNRMSLKPAIGKRWLEKYQTDVFPSDFVIVNGRKVKPPKYYDALFQKIHKESDEKILFFESLQFDRIQNARKHAQNNTTERLLVRNLVKEAQASQLKRNL